MDVVLIMTTVISFVFQSVNCKFLGSYSSSFNHSCNRGLNPAPGSQRPCSYTLLVQIKFGCQVCSALLSLGWESKNSLQQQNPKVVQPQWIRAANTVSRESWMHSHPPLLFAAKHQRATRDAACAVLYQHLWGFKLPEMYIWFPFANIELPAWFHGAARQWNSVEVVKRPRVAWWLPSRDSLQGPIIHSFLDDIQQGLLYDH